jgi:hypothetical protein
VLESQVGELLAGEVFYIPEFKDGSVYIRVENKMYLVEHDTLKDAVSKSDQLASYFTADLLATIEKELVVQQ